MSDSNFDVVETAIYSIDDFIIELKSILSEPLLKLGVG